MPTDVIDTRDDYPPYNPTTKELECIMDVLSVFDKGRSIQQKGYNYFGGQSLLESIDDWTKRWNGYIPPMNPLIDATQSQIFVNFTRNAIIAYLSKVALAQMQTHIVPVNKKSGIINQKFADVVEDLNTYSLQAENGEAKFLQAALECVVKGTVVVYEGYARNTQDTDLPVKFDAKTGELETKKGERVIIDDCFQEVIPLEDFFITNPFQADVQKQPDVVWRKLTTYQEAAMEYSHYKSWQYVKPGSYTMANDVTTFYRNMILTDLQKDQVEILKRYNRSKNKLQVLVNGVVLYDGRLPFKDGKYPFAKTVNEPFGNDFFWGNGHPNKYMGEQDLINTFINMMADKTFNSLQYTGLSSDLDDLIDDDRLEIGKIRQVNDVNAWKWWESPPVNAGEMQMFQEVMNLAKDSASLGGGSQFSPKGGKLSQQQIMLQQQEMMNMLSFSMNFLEDLERDRTELRIDHILQFYSIPKITKITGKKPGELQGMVYRDVQLNDVKLSSGAKGTKLIKLVNNDHLKNPDKRKQLEDHLSLLELKGQEQGTPTEALAVSVDSFYDYNMSIQVVKNSSYKKNQALDQATRMEFANWRIGLMDHIPLPNPQGLVKWVEDAFDIDTDTFESAPAGATPGMPGQQPGQGATPPGPAAGQNNAPKTLQNNQPSALERNATKTM